MQAGLTNVRTGQQQPSCPRKRARTSLADIGNSQQVPNNDWQAPGGGSRGAGGDGGEGGSDAPDFHVDGADGGEDDPLAVPPGVPPTILPPPSRVRELIESL